MTIDTLKRNIEGIKVIINAVSQSNTVWDVSHGAHTGTSFKKEFTHDLECAIEMLDEALGTIDKYFPDEEENIPSDFDQHNTLNHVQQGTL